MKNIGIVVLVGIILIMGSSCNSNSQENKPHAHKHQESENHEASDSENHEVVSLTLEQIQMMDIRTSSVLTVNLKKAVKCNGFLELPPQNKASLGAIVSGRVSNILVIEGNQVKKGQTLAILENPVIIDWQKDYLQLKSELEFMESDYRRKSALYTDSIGSGKDFQKVKANFEATKSKLAAIESHLRMIHMDVTKITNENITSKFKVIAPISGHVKKVHITMGQFVQQQEVMFEIVDIDHIHMDLMVFEKDIDKVKVNQKVVFSIATHPEIVFEGNVFSVGKSFEGEIKSLKVHAEITSKPEGLLPGMYVEARIITDSNNVLAVPADAILNEKGLQYVFVETHQENGRVSFLKRQVVKGVEDMGYTQISFVHPAKTDSKIVISGAYYLLAELNKDEVEGHEH